MKTRRKVELMAVAAVALAAAGYFLWPDGGPKHDGKPVSYWFRQYYLVGEGNEAAYTQEQLNEVLHKLGTNALPYLVKQALSTSKDTAFRTNFYEWLGKLPASWHPPPFVSYDDIRTEAVDAIDEINPSAEVILPFVRRALEGPDGMQRLQALRVIDVVREGWEELMPWLLGALRSTNMDCVEIGVHNVGAMGADAKRAVPDLIAILKDREGQKYVAFHSHVVGGLGIIGPAAGAAIPVLKEYFARETNWDERSTAATALCKIDAQQTEALSYLIETLKSPHEQAFGIPDSPTPYIAVRAAEAAERLGKIGTNARPAIPALIECLNSTNIALVTAAAEALHGIGAPKETFLPKLEESLKRYDEPERLKIASVIMWSVEQTNQAALSTLAAAMKGPPSSQRMAIFSLRGFGIPPKELVPTLQDGLKSSDPTVQSLALEMLNEIEAREKGK